MLRPVTLLPALVALLATTIPGPIASADSAPGGADDRAPQVSRTAVRSAPAAARNDDPLLVDIESLAPSTVPTQGPIRISGSLTNQSDETWRAINLHPFVGGEPITSSADLAAATDRGAKEYVGDRIISPGAFDTITSLEPGQSLQFSIKLPSKLLGLSEPGVYWFGVHAIGETATVARDSVADGRARTFLPLVPRTKKSVRTALVLPIRRQVQHSSDGRVGDVRGWAQDLESGPLRSLVDFGASAGSRPLTWLVDPAVPEAVQHLVTGNPERSLDDTVIEPVEGEGETASSDPTPEPSPSGSGAPGPDAEEVPENAATEPGNDWLNRFREAVDGDQVLALPYGDLDLSAAAAHDSQSYVQARRRSGRELQPFGLATSPAIAAPNGFLDPQALGLIPPRATVLMTEKQFGGGPPGVADVSGRRVVVTSTAAEGGPSPSDPLAAIALRQQVLSEAAIRLLDPERPPLVVVLPQDWTPSSTNGFFSGLDVDWLRLTDLDGLGRRADTQVEADQLSYSEKHQQRELDAANFAAAQALTNAGTTLQNVLTSNDEVGDTVADEALTGLSYASREEPDAARVRAELSGRWIGGQLARIRIRAPRAVTLSSNRGQFAATLVNELEHPVQVRVEAVLDAPMEIQGPETIQIAASSRTSVLLDASTSRLGVSNVQLLVTDEAGTPLGSTDELPIRSGQVSQVIWLIMGAGLALLFGAIVVRLVRRIRRSRRAA